MANEDLTDAVQGFRAAEDSIADLVDQADQLQTAAGALAEAKSGVDASATELRTAAQNLMDLGNQFGRVATELESATKALIESDPEGVKRELARSVDQIERLRSRLDEATGETRSNIDRLGNRIDEATGESRASAEALQRTTTHLRVLVVLTLIAAIAAAVVPFVAP